MSLKFTLATDIGRDNTVSKMGSGRSSIPGRDVFMSIYGCHLNHYGTRPAEENRAKFPCSKDGYSTKLTFILYHVIEECLEIYLAFHIRLQIAVIFKKQSKIYFLITSVSVTLLEYGLNASVMTLCARYSATVQTARTP